MNADDVAFIRSVAYNKHIGQKYGDFVYSVHLEDVEKVLKRFGYTGEVLTVVALLHDVLEDTDTTPGELLGICHAAHATPQEGLTILSAVKFCTDEEGPNRRLRKRATYLRNRTFVDGFLRRPYDPANQDATYIGVREGLTVKLADRVANIESCITSSNEGLFRMYKKEQEAFYIAHFSHLHVPMWDHYDALLNAVP